MYVSAGVITTAVSCKSCRSSNSEGLGTAFEEVFGPFDPIPATLGIIAAGPSRRSSLLAIQYLSLMTCVGVAL